MLERLADSALGKAADWMMNKVAGLRKRLDARAALLGGDALGALTAQGQVSAAIEQLLREPRLPDGLMQVDAVREWLADAKTQKAFTQYLQARLGGNPNLANFALTSLAQGYSQATGEVPRRALGHAEAVASYVATMISDAPNFLAAQVAEIAADHLESRLARDVAPNLDALRAEVRDLLQDAPRAAKLLDQRIPCAFATEVKAGTHERLDVSSLMGLLTERKLVVIAGEGGIGKTTALLELGEALIQIPGMPVPLYASAPNWLGSKKPLLDYLASRGPVQRAAIDRDGLSSLFLNGKVTLLLNGWNEIAAADKARAIADAEDFLADHRGAMVVCTSRRAEGPFAAATGVVVNVLEFNWDRQRELVARALPGAASDGLLNRLQTDTQLRHTARNPLILSSAILLAQRGREVPATMYGLLEAVQPILEAPDQRQDALKGAPLYGQHYTYLKALARYLTDAGKVDMHLDEGRRVVGNALAELQQLGAVQGRDIEPSEIIDALCNTHLLHREHDSEVLKFCHQRFQEFFAATWVLEKLAVDRLTVAQQQDLVREVFNRPAWTESLDLLAEKLVADGRAAPRAQLVALATRADLSLASKLAGEVQMGAETNGPFLQLIEGIRELHAATSNSAKNHALACMALTRSPVFESELTALLETTDRLGALALIHGAGGLSVKSFGDDIANRFSAWRIEQKHNLLKELGSQRENLLFLKDVACCDADPGVRARGITILAWQFPASDAALEAWLASPDNTKLNREAFHSVIDVGNDELLPALLSEVQRLAKATGDKSLLLQLALQLPMSERGFALDAAKEALAKSDVIHHLRDETLQLVALLDPAALQAIAEEKLLQHREVHDWVASHLDALPQAERSAAFARVFARAKVSNIDKVDAVRIGKLAGGTEVKAVLDEWLGVSRSDPESQNLERFLSRVLRAASTEDLCAAALARTDKPNYSQARRTLQLLIEPQFVERSADNRDQRRRTLRPEAAQSLLDAYWDLPDPDGTHAAGVKASLCLVLSQADSVRFADKIFEGLMLEAERRATFVKERRPASGTSYGDEFARAAITGGAAMAKRLLPLLDAQDEGNVLFDVIQRIAMLAWPRKGFHGQLDIAARQQRIAEGFVLRQRDQELQDVTDQFALKIASRLEASGDAAVSPRENLFNRRWWLMTSLANLPTRVGWPDLRKSLIRPDVLPDRFVHALNALVSQGETIDDDAVVAAIQHRFSERIASTAWFDQHDTSMEDLAALHFFISEAKLPPHALDAMVDQWAGKAQSCLVLRKLREIDTPAAMAQLSRLTLNGVFERTEEAIQALIDGPNGPAKLLELALDGSLFKFLKGYFDARQVASVLAPLVQGRPDILHQVLGSCTKQNTKAGEELAFELVSAIPEPGTKALDYLLEFLDRAGRNGKGRLSISFERMFEEREPVEGSSNTHNLYSRACNHVRTGLFEMAMAAGPSAALAAETLFEIEEIRLSLGRPHDEPRHPNVDSEHRWPQCLATVL